MMSCGDVAPYWLISKSYSWKSGFCSFGAFSTLQWRCRVVLKVWYLLNYDSLGLRSPVQQLMKGSHTAAAAQDEQQVGAFDIFFTDSSLFSF